MFLLNTVCSSEEIRCSRDERQCSGEEHGVRERRYGVPSRISETEHRQSGRAWEDVQREGGEGGRKTTEIGIRES